MACPQIENKLVGVRFLMHGVANHVLLRQKGLDFIKSKSTLSISMFNSHAMVWFPRVTEKNMPRHEA
jgi:hypothetical protein